MTVHKEYGPKPVEISVIITAVLCSAGLGAGSSFIDWTRAPLEMAGGAAFIGGSLGACMHSSLIEGLFFTIAMGGICLTLVLVAPNLLEGEITQLILPAVVGFCASKLVIGVASEMD
ncbi:MAG: hypothetical protein ACYTGQ_20400 [Planctomycetota bacterium]|jgi:hypothetical protein